ncbi:MAG: GNAT family N-acetyltransferase [Boseongicola sp.]|nr:GNAT family N-acetyltransferase [Boseongicola sp.]MDD9976757.1 GNAT family N-acetyltransferase [Boseongicola sp.]
MDVEANHLETRLAVSNQDILSAAKLRYRVFVEELGAQSDSMDHVHRIEQDHFDKFAQNIVLIDKRVDPSTENHVVGVYRLLDEAGAEKAGGFYCDDEFDLSKLKASGMKLLELGRSCIDAKYRGGAGLFLLWQALATYVEEHEIDVLFGVASFHGTDVAKHAASLSLLHREYLVSDLLRVTAKGPTKHSMDLVVDGKFDRTAAMKAVPALLKGYLRLGGRVGDSAFVDHAFNTTDVCLILESAKANTQSLARFAGRMS